MKIKELPTPGLDGTYTSACVACMRGTDTGLGVRGEAEWHIAFLAVLGVPDDEAEETERAATGCDPGKVLTGAYESVVRVCTECVRAAKPQFPAPVLLVGDAAIPCIGQS